MIFTKKPLKVGIAFGGGAARGFAHLGVIKALEESGITPSFIAGTSVGSLIGGLYAAGLSWKNIWDIAEDLDWGDLVKITMPHMGLVKPDSLESLVNKLTEKATIEGLPVPFTAVAVDIIRGEKVELTSGSLAKAVRASCSIPGIFVPLELDDQLLVDGGVINNLPGDVVKKMGAEFVISIDLTGLGNLPDEKPENLAAVIFRSMFLLMSGTGAMGARASDLVITPEIDHIGYHQMGKKEELLELGYTSTKIALESLGKRLKQLQS
jgi:NTE family protein